MNHNILIRPVSLHDIPLIHAAAEKDHHGVAAPSHVVLKDGDVVGYLSMLIVPTVLLWLDSKQCRASDTLFTQQYIEDFMAAHNQLGYLVPIPADSPVTPYTQKLGLQLASPNTMIYFKSLSDKLTATTAPDSKEGK